MATQLNEEKMINENMFKFEQKLKSPIRRFTDKSFTPVKYWHIKSNQSTSDPGFNDISQLLGEESPLRFQVINNLPLYGMETFILALNDTEQGLDGSFESEAIIMAGTIVPSQNDFFMLTQLHESYIFRVIGIEYDSVSTAPCYKIQYTLEYIDNEKKENLEKQTINEFSCVLENIGTDERCIIESSEKEKIDAIDRMYDKIAKTYITFFYNERYNCLLGDFGENLQLFDPFMIEFINTHMLFQKRGSIDNLVMTEQFADNKRARKYQKSIYRYFETRDSSMLKTFDYVVFSGMNNKQTSFYRWLDSSVVILDIPKEIDPENHYSVMSKEFAESIRLNGPVETKYGNLIKRFARKEELTIDDIDLTLHDEMLTLEDSDLEIFFYTPIILYIIKCIVKENLRTVFED